MTRPEQPSRIVCECQGAEPGLRVAIVTGLHGNEPDPGEALCELPAVLAEIGGLRRGRLTVFRGNLPALAAGCRYLDRDLNRGWNEGRLEQLSAGAELEATQEDRQQIELYQAVEAFLGPQRRGRALFDLHSFSGEGRPFALGTDRGLHRKLAESLGLSMVFGLQEALAGALSDFYDARAEISMAVETGRSGEEGIGQRVRAFVLRILGRLEMVDGAADEPLPPANPAILRVSYRHPVQPEDGFSMLEGFRSFQPVRRGEALARDVDGVIHAPHDGWLLMPLYQSVGSDGFFLVQREDSS